MTSDKAGKADKFQILEMQRFHNGSVDQKTNMDSANLQSTLQIDSEFLKNNKLMES